MPLFSAPSSGGGASNQLIANQTSGQTADPFQLNHPTGIALVNSDVHGNVNINGGTLVVTAPHIDPFTVTPGSGPVLYTYIIQAVDASGNIYAPQVVDANGPTGPLTSSTYNTITFSAAKGAVKYYVSRQYGGSGIPTGLISTITATGAASYTLKDTGQTPTTSPFNSTGFSGAGIEVHYRVNQSNLPFKIFSPDWGSSPVVSMDGYGNLFLAGAAYGNGGSSQYIANTSSGSYGFSPSSGGNSEATGATASGYGATASGYCSSAFGSSRAYGDGSFAAGTSSAYGNNATTFGGSQASGNNSASFGSSVGNANNVLTYGYATATLMGQRVGSTAGALAYGDNQHGDATLIGSTNSTTQVELTADGVGVSGNNCFPIPLNCTLGFDIKITARKTGGGGGYFVRRCVIQNVSGTTSVLGTVQTIGIDINSPSPLRTVTVQANAATNCLQILVANGTSDSAVTLWVSEIYFSQLIL